INGIEAHVLERGQARGRQAREDESRQRLADGRGLARVEDAGEPLERLALRGLQSYLLSDLLDVDVVGLGHRGGRAWRQDTVGYQADADPGLDDGPGGIEVLILGGRSVAADRGQ